jgi:hypothetical protein
MKKILSLLLAAVIVLSLCACGGAKAGGTTAPTEPMSALAASTGLKDGQILAGYAMCDITPEDSVPMGGFGNPDQRMSTGFLDYLYATILVVTDKYDNTAILVGMDLCGSAGGLFTGLRTALSETYGIPESSIVFSASHTHAAPNLGSNTPAMSKWNTTVSTRIRKAVQEAMDDRAPADIYRNSAETKGLNFVRRYVLEGNIYVGYQSDINEHPELEVIGHETDADPVLQFIKFDRAEKSDIIMANFQTHPHRGSSAKTTQFTADLVGAFRQELENKMGVNVVYFTGASGNINPTSQIAEENATKSFQEQGKALAKYVIDAEESSYIKVNGGKVQSTTATFEGLIDHSQDHLVAIAGQANARWQQTNDIPTIRREYLQYGINSPYHAGAIISKAGKGEKESFDIWAISFGDVGFVVAPYEMFDTNGMFIKENSPFDITIVATCANGANGYFPSLIACEHGGYEPDTTKYVHGSAETLADQYVGMLEGLYKNR